MNQRNKENLQNEADQQVRSYSYNKQSMHSEKTKRYTFNEKGEIIDINKRLIVPQLKVKEILIENHDHILAGHLGIAKTIARIKRHYICIEEGCSCTRDQLYTMCQKKSNRCNKGSFATTFTGI